MKGVEDRDVSVTESFLRRVSLTAFGSLGTETVTGHPYYRCQSVSIGLLSSISSLARSGPRCRSSTNSVHVSDLSRVSPEERDTVYVVVTVREDRGENRV